jgi:hypothetical protein
VCLSKVILNRIVFSFNKIENLKIMVSLLSLLYLIFSWENRNPLNPVCFIGIEFYSNKILKLKKRTCDQFKGVRQFLANGHIPWLVLFHMCIYICVIHFMRSMRIIHSSTSLYLVSITLQHVISIAREIREARKRKKGKWRTDIRVVNGNSSVRNYCATLGLHAASTVVSNPLWIKNKINTNVRMCLVGATRPRLAASAPASGQHATAPRPHSSSRRGWGRRAQARGASTPTPGQGRRIRAGPGQLRPSHHANASAHTVLAATASRWGERLRFQTLTASLIWPHLDGPR